MIAGATDEKLLIYVLPKKKKRIISQVLNCWCVSVASEELGVQSSHVIMMALNPKIDRATWGLLGRSDM